MNVQLRPADAADLPRLARMNRRLIEDQRSRNRMSLVQLEDRLRAWLSGEWKIFVLETGGEPVGYFVCRRRKDEYDSARLEIYIRQFFVERGFRGAGIGSSAFRRFLDETAPSDATLVVDVLQSNPAALRFWQSLGFRPYCTTLRFDRGTST